MEPKFIIVIRANDGGSNITKAITLADVIHCVSIDRCEETQSAEEISDWVNEWFENSPSSVDSQTMLCDKPHWTIIRTA